MKKIPRNKKGSFERDVCVVGGAGHVGLPLALVFVKKGLKTTIYDINRPWLDEIRKGRMPFMEEGSEPLLRSALKSGRFEITDQPSSVAKARVIVITIGTPVDEFLNPDTKVIRRCVDGLLPYLRKGQLILLRSTVYPGTTAWLEKYLKQKGKKVLLSFCPERVVQGRAIEEVQKLPQIVSGTTPEAEKAASELFLKIAPETVVLQPMEAEFAKLFSNAYRYIQFAISNQFYMIAKSAKLDFNRIIDGMKKDYPRAKEIPRAGLAAGPCLLKDTMQLAAFSDNQFTLGHTAMMINEGLALHMVGELEKCYPLGKMKVGLLGMAFKADSDDTRSSLSYKLKKALQYHAREVLTTDPHVTTDPEILPLQKVLKEADLFVLCVPHGAYKNLRILKKPVFDIWGYLRSGGAD